MSPDTPQRSLFRKLAEVMGEVERVKKTGRNEFHRYDYATEADIVSAVREGMSKRHVMIVPNVEALEFSELARKNGTERLARVRVRFTLIDGDSGETHAFELFGEGADVGDKAFYKALTGATKYALLKLFLIPTGDDPEAEAEAPTRQRSQPRPAPPAEPPRPAPAPSAHVQQESKRVAAAVGGQVVTLDWGPYKGRALSTLTDDELSSFHALANACLTTGKRPNGQPLSNGGRGTLQGVVVDIEIEVDNRTRKHAEPGANG